MAAKSKEPLWIEVRDVLAIHDRLLAIHGGAPGLRDQGLLESALARPRQHHAYARSPDVIEMAALYTAGVVRNHPFSDGNKRTGFVVDGHLRVSLAISRKEPSIPVGYGTVGSGRHHKVSV